MEKRIKIFCQEEPREIQEIVNEWLEDEKGKLHEVHVNVVNYEDFPEIYITLVYTPDSDTYQPHYEDK